MSGNVVRQLACLGTSLVAKLDEILVALGTPAAAVPDYEIVTTSWLCDEGGTDTWVRTETTYIDGVAGTPVVIDSGIPCTEPAPAAVVEVDVELVCNAATGFFDEYRVVTTDGVAAAPVITATTISCAPAELTQAIQLPDTCVTVDGANPRYATPVRLFNQTTATLAATVWLDRDGSEIAGVVAVTEDCDCDCASCTVEGCLGMAGFDAQTITDFTPGQTNTFDVLNNGALVATVVLDYTVESDGVNKSSWYTQLVAAIAANTNFNLSVIAGADAPIASSQRVEWNVEYEGPGNETLTIVQGPDTRILTADQDGLVTGTAEELGTPFGTDPFFDCNLLEV